jgi:hypothetical protein
MIFGLFFDSMGWQGIALPVIMPYAATAIISTTISITVRARWVGIVIHRWRRCIIHWRRRCIHVSRRPAIKRCSITSCIGTNGAEANSATTQR